MKLADLGEFGFIERIRRSVAGAEGVEIGIGDDCAVLSLPPGHRLLTSTDLLIEDVHFRRAWTSSELLGRKSVSVNVSDIAAMGGQPRHLYLGLGIPASMPVEELDAFIGGFLQGCSDYGATLVGGDTCRSPGPLFISVTAEGAVPEGQLLRRSGAGVGDAIYVSGTLGDSALGLRQLLEGQEPEPFLAGRHHDPTARVELGRRLAETAIASSMIDLSDGLLADLGHVLQASAAGAEVCEAALPLSEPFRRTLAEAPELLELALSGGEDYELLFTVPPGKEEALAELARSSCVALTRVGRILTAGAGYVLVDPQGGRRPARASGFNHFR